MEIDFNNGRIRDIIFAIKNYYEVDSLEILSPLQKLEILCKSIDFTIEDLDLLISSNSPVLRTIKGHAFERVFDELIIQNGYEVIEVGGDNGIDRIVNGHQLQLKTPNKSGTKNGYVEYKTHKTHGAKSSNESEEYLYEKSKFADFFVGLISYSPFQVALIPREELPGHPLDPNRIKSPFKIPLVEERINGFHHIGINNIDIKKINEAIKPEIGKELLPLSSEKLELKSNIIIDVILNENNFRIWDMNMRGFAREYAFKGFLNQHNVRSEDPKLHRKDRYDKADKTLFLKGSPPIFLQLKGLTFTLIDFSKMRIGVESQLSRGRINDHPTQSRLYLETDFEYLVVCIDPCYVKRLSEDKGGFSVFEWRFYAIPVAIALRHGMYVNRIKPIQRFIYSDIEKFRINEEWLEKFEKNDTSNLL